MKTTNEALKIVTHDNAEPTKSATSKSTGLNSAEELDPTRLMDLLGDIEGLKREIHERMRRIEAVKEAKSLLMDDAQRTDALNKRLAEIGKAMNAVHSGFHVGGEGYEDPEVLRLLGREHLSVAEVRSTTARSATEGVAIAWPKVEEPAQPHMTIMEAPAEDLAQIDEHPIADSDAPVELSQTVSYVEFSESATAVQEPGSLESDPAAPKADTSVSPWAIPAEAMAIVEAPAPVESVVEAEAPAPVEPLVPEDSIILKESAPVAEIVPVAPSIAPELLAEWEQRWQQANDSIAEAKLLLEEAKTRLDQAAAREESVAADFRTSQREQKLAFESASQRLEQAERFWREADQFGATSKQSLEQSNLALVEARLREESASTELKSARQELTTAYQFASVAAQRRLESAEFFERTARWSVFAAASSWIAMIWIGWVALVAAHKNATIVLPVLATAIVLLVGMVLVKRRVKEPEDR